MKHVAAGTAVRYAGQTGRPRGHQYCPRIDGVRAKSRQGEADADRRMASLMESIDQQMPSMLVPVSFTLLSLSLLCYRFCVVLT